MQLMNGRRRLAWPALTAAGALALAAWCIGHVEDAHAKDADSAAAPSAEEEATAYDRSKPYALKWASWDLSAPADKAARVARKGEPDGKQPKLDGLDVGEKR
jgi:hypothetical protein